MNVTWITMYTGQGLKPDMDKGVFDRFRSLPIWRPAVLVGMLLADAVRYTISCAVMLAVGHRPRLPPRGGVVGVLAAVALLLVFSFCLSWVWTTIGSTSRRPSR